MPVITKETKEGEKFIGKIRTITQERLNYFSGGFPKGPDWPAKNIHTDLQTAKKAGLKCVAASGAMFEGHLIDLMVDLFGERWLTYGAMSLSFINIMDRDDTLLPKAVVKAKKSLISQIEFTLEICCENQHGMKVVVGTGRGVIP